MFSSIAALAIRFGRMSPLDNARGSKRRSEVMGCSARSVGPCLAEGSDMFSSASMNSVHKHVRQPAEPVPHVRGDGHLEPRDSNREAQSGVSTLLPTFRPYSRSPYASAARQHG